MKFRNVNVGDAWATTWVFFDVRVEFPLREHVVELVRRKLNYRLPVSPHVEPRKGDTLRVFVPLDVYEMGKKAVEEVVGELEASYEDFRRLAIWMEEKVE